MYTDHYGLTGQPFQLTPDARFWFDSRTHKKAMAYLGYGLAQGEGFIVITGEIGAGKSTLVAHLMATIDRARLNAISLVSTQVEGDDMLRLVAQGLGLATERRREGAAARRGSSSGSTRKLRAGKRTLLIVDEAQNLPVSALEELRMLSNFQVGGRALFRSSCSASPNSATSSPAPGLEQLRQRVIATHHLDAMGADEVEAYIRHRLTRVGWQGNPDFEPDAFAAVYRHSGGIPRRVNQLAHRLLLHAALEGAEPIGADDGRGGRRRHGRRCRRARAASARGEGASAARPPAACRPDRAPRAAAATAPDPALERRIAALEARLEEQEAMLRRVLTLLVDWVENGSQETAYRTHAA